MDEKEKDKINSDFHNQLSELLEQYREEGGDPFDIIDGLMSQIKIEASLVFSCYYHALGLCTEVLNKGFEELYNNINSAKEG